MKRLKTELVYCLRRSLILLWEGQSPPKRPVSPHLDSQRMAFFIGTRSGFFTFFPLALTAVRGSVGNCSHNKQVTARSTGTVQPHMWELRPIQIFPKHLSQPKPQPWSSTGPALQPSTSGYVRTSLPGSVGVRLT